MKQQRERPAAFATVRDERTRRLLADIRQIWKSAQASVVRSVNTAHVVASWMIGREIVESQQQGMKRARYGEAVLALLSRHLVREFGAGFSLSSLKYMRSFYREYPKLLQGISHPLGDQSALSNPRQPVAGQSHTARQWTPGRLHTSLSWRHYRALMRVDNDQARSFYEIEATKNNWSGRELERQIDSMLFFRLLKSRDKKGVMALAEEGHKATAPVDIIKDPFVLEFLDLPESNQLSETNVETALITKLKDFLLELGSGFAFVGRQKRLTLEGDHFFTDLVFYHIRLKCYVIIDLKTRKLTHGDLGQMLMYVHYYDREVCIPSDNPTIGLILCTDKNDAMAEYVLDEASRQIFASRYRNELPSPDQLRSELKREVALLRTPRRQGRKLPRQAVPRHSVGARSAERGDGQA